MQVSRFTHQFFLVDVNAFQQIFELISTKQVSDVPYSHNDPGLGQAPQNSAIRRGTAAPCLQILHARGPVAEVSARALVLIFSGNKAIKPIGCRFPLHGLAKFVRFS